MRIMVLGSRGMLGHQLVKLFKEKKHEVYPVGRAEVDATSTSAVSRLGGTMLQWKPDVVVNAIGIVKQREATAAEFIYVNALLPHLLFKLTQAVDARLIHFSTDCVFSGLPGTPKPYVEDDTPDPRDLYGRTKLLGEIEAKGCLTIRTSIIGPELDRKLGLYEWFRTQQKKPVKGYTKAFFSGLTTLELSRLVESVIVNYTTIHGVWHVGGDAISKYALLRLLGANVEPDDSVVCDRTLNSHRFRARTRHYPPTWSAMVKELLEKYPL